MHALLCVGCQGNQVCAITTEWSHLQRPHETVKPDDSDKTTVVVNLKGYVNVTVLFYLIFSNKGTDDPKMQKINKYSPLVILNL